MANARKPAKPGQTDNEIAHRLAELVGNTVSVLGEHFEGVVIIGTYRDSAGRQRATVWNDGNEYAAYGAAKDYVLTSEANMKHGTFAPSGQTGPDEVEK